MSNTIENLLRVQNDILNNLVREVRSLNPKVSNQRTTAESNPCDEIALGPSKPSTLTMEEPKTWVIAYFVENHGLGTGRLTPLNEYYGFKKDAENVLNKFRTLHGENVKLFTIQEYFDMKHQSAKKANQHNVPSQAELEAMLTDLFSALIPKTPEKPKYKPQNFDPNELKKGPWSNN